MSRRGGETPCAFYSSRMYIERQAFFIKTSPFLAEFFPDRAAQDVSWKVDLHLSGILDNSSGVCSPSPSRVPSAPSRWPPVSRGDLRSHGSPRKWQTSYRPSQSDLPMRPKGGTSLQILISYSGPIGVFSQKVDPNGATMAEFATGDLVLGRYAPG